MRLHSPTARIEDQCLVQCTPRQVKRVDHLENACGCLHFVQHVGRIFALKKKAKGSGHVWKEFKAEFNANETEDDVTIEWNNNNKGVRKRMYPRTTDTTTKVTISIMFYYTDAFANLTSDIVTYIDHVLDIANQGYINSGLPITVNPRKQDSAKLTLFHSGDEAMH